MAHHRCHPRAARPGAAGPRLAPLRPRNRPGSVPRGGAARCPAAPRHRRTRGAARTPVPGSLRGAGPRHPGPAGQPGGGADPGRPARPLRPGRGAAGGRFPAPGLPHRARSRRPGDGRPPSAAQAVADGTLDWARLRDSAPDVAEATLVALPGIGPWTAAYMLMRVLGHPDAFPAGDLGVRQALARLRPSSGPWNESRARRRAEVWRPWRSYATLALWASLRRRDGGGAR